MIWSCIGLRFAGQSPPDQRQLDLPLALTIFAGAVDAEPLLSASLLHSRGTLLLDVAVGPKAVGDCWSETDVSDFLVAVAVRCSHCCPDIIALTRMAFHLWFKRVLSASNRR